MDLAKMARWYEGNRGVPMRLTHRIAVDATARAYRRFGARDAAKQR